MGRRHPRQRGQALFVIRLNFRHWTPTATNCRMIGNRRFEVTWAHAMIRMATKTQTGNRTFPNILPAPIRDPLRHVSGSPQQEPRTQTCGCFGLRILRSGTVFLPPRIYATGTSLERLLWETEQRQVSRSLRLSPGRNGSTAYRRSPNDAITQPRFCGNAQAKPSNFCAQLSLRRRTGR